MNPPAPLPDMLMPALEHLVTTIGQDGDTAQRVATALYQGVGGTIDQDKTVVQKGLRAKLARQVRNDLKRDYAVNNPMAGGMQGAVAHSIISDADRVEEIAQRIQTTPVARAPEHCLPGDRRPFCLPSGGGVSPVGDSGFNQGIWCTVPGGQRNDSWNVFMDVHMNCRYVIWGCAQPHHADDQLIGWSGERPNWAGANGYDTQCGNAGGGGGGGPLPPVGPLPINPTLPVPPCPPCPPTPLPRPARERAGCQPLDPSLPGQRSFIVPWFDGPPNVDPGAWSQCGEKRIEDAFHALFPVSEIVDAIAQYGHRWFGHYIGHTTQMLPDPPLDEDSGSGNGYIGGV